MRQFAMVLGCLSLGACASTGGLSEQSRSTAATNGPSASFAASSVPEVDASTYGGPGSNVCRRETIVGSRIIRDRCFVVTGAEKDLLEAQTAFEIEYAREQALLDEQERLDRWALQGQPPQQQQQPF